MPKDKKQYFFINIKITLSKIIYYSNNKLKCIYFAFMTHLRNYSRHARFHIEI